MTIIGQVILTSKKQIRRFDIYATREKVGVDDEEEYPLFRDTAKRVRQVMIEDIDGMRWVNVQPRNVVLF